MYDISRRHVLKAIAAGAGLAAFRPVAGALAATDRAYPRAGIPPAGSLPNPGLAPGTDTLPDIKHIVVVMMENHAYFGALGRGDGLRMHNGKPANACLDHHGAPVYSHHASASTCQAHNSVSQSWNASHRCWNSGRMDGFVTANSPSAMAYWTGEDIPFYWSLAKTFTLCDRYFSSVMAQT